MRAAIVHHLLSGQAWFSAGAVLTLLLAAESSGWLASRPPLLRLGRVLFLLAIGVAALSGTPVPLWLLVPLALSLAGVVATGFRVEPTRTGRASSSAALCAAIVAMAVEAPYHRAPHIELPRGATVVVLGDSLSSGGFGETAPWPERLAGMTGARVANLALPSETLRSAVRYQLPRLRDPAPGLILIELGGNDILEGKSSAAFEADLDALLTELDAPGDEPAIAMFELPLLPGRWSWGAAQRRLAREHGVALVPKRFLTRVLSNPRFAGDGLHPTSEGHEALARGIASLAVTKG